MISAETNAGKHSKQTAGRAKKRAGALQSGFILISAALFGAAAAAGLHLHLYGGLRPELKQSDTNEANPERQIDEMGQENSAAGKSINNTETDSVDARKQRVEELYSMLHPPDSRREALQSIQEGRERIKALHSAADGSRRSADEMMDDKPR